MGSERLAEVACRYDAGAITGRADVANGGVAYTLPGALCHDFLRAMLATVASGWVSQDALLSNAANPGLATLVMLVLISFALEKPVY